MKNACAAFACLTLLLSAQPAQAENWVTVADDEDFWIDVDADSIHRGSDGLVYYRERTLDTADMAVDCARRITYTIKIYVHGGLEYPNWREQGSEVVSGSIGEMAVNYVCARA